MAGSRRSFEGGLTLKGIRTAEAGAKGEGKGVGTGGPLEAGTLSAADTPIPFGEIFFAASGGGAGAGSSGVGDAAGTSPGLILASLGSESRIGRIGGGETAAGSGSFTAGCSTGAGAGGRGVSGAAFSSLIAAAETGAGTGAGPGSAEAETTGAGGGAGVADFPKRLPSSIVTFRKGVSTCGTDSPAS